MTGAYIHPRVIQILLGMNFAMFSFSFIPIEQTPLVTDLFNFIDYDQSDDYLDLVGLTSGSAILNHIALLLIFAVFGIYHLSLIPCHQASKQLKESNLFRIVMKFLFNMMTFSIYVVLVLESYLIVLLSTVYEIKEFDHSTGFKIFSLVFAFIFGLMLTVSLVISVV
jgi:hypothetical protein